MTEIVYNIAGGIVVFIFLCLAVAEYHNAKNSKDDE